MKDLLDLPNHPNLTAAEVATFLKISRTMAYDMLQQGLLPRLKVQGLWRIPRERFIQWYEQQMEFQERMSA